MSNPSPRTENSASTTAIVGLFASLLACGQGGEISGPVRRASDTASAEADTAASGLSAGAIGGGSLIANAGVGNATGSAAEGGAGAVSGRGGNRAGRGAGNSAGTSAQAGRVGSADVGNSGILVPAQGVLLGEYYGDGTVAETETRIGRKQVLHLNYYTFVDDWPRQAASDLAAGKIPLVNWEPEGIDFNDIVAGKMDATIKMRAMAAQAIGKKFFLDFAAEMNGDVGWGGHNPTLYINAYRHIHDLFVQAGATNVVWAWCPNVADVDGSTKQTLSYYPGDDYVDWVGVDGYNWGEGNGFKWQSFRDVFARIYPVLVTKNKPILICEMASDENGGDKGAWIDTIVPTLRNDFPQIKGVVWFDVKKERQWQVNSSPASLAAYMRLTGDPYVNP